MKKLAVLSLSGGMDSTSLLLHLLNNGYEVRAISFNYGQRHQIELMRLQKNLSYLEESGYPVRWDVVDLISAFSDSTSSLVASSNIEIPEGHYEDITMKSTVVENRNPIFSAIIYSKALAWANKEKCKVLISLGIHAGDHEIYPDCRQESRDALAHAFKISNWGSENVDYYTPYLDIDKVGILKDLQVSCINLNLSFNEILRNTNTCYSPNEKGEACGKCGSCQERLEAFEKLNIKDPVSYVK